MDKDDQIFLNHIKDLQQRAFNKGIITYSEFLGLSEQTLLYNHPKETGVNYPVLYGGFDFSERKICVFDGSDGYMYPLYPISCLKIIPLSGKFTESLSHRDFLGSLMGLGIKRETLGDIYVNDSTAYIICLDSIAGFIKDNLCQVKKTRVSVIDSDFDIDYKPLNEEIHPSVSSLRIDAMVSAAINVARGVSQELITQRKVFINGREVQKDSKELSPGDIVSVRGFGRFSLKSIDNTTRKGRTIVTIIKYL